MQPTACSHHAPRIERAFKNLLFGLLMLLPGLYLALNDLPRTSSYLVQIRLAGLPLFFGAVVFLFGCWGLVTGLMGAARKGADAIDLKTSADGITVRGGRTIPWRSISRVTALTYYDGAAMTVIWDRADLNRGFVLALSEPLDVPGVTTRDGRPELRIRLLRYPAVDYRAVYDEVVAEFARRGIPVEQRATSKSR